MDVRTYLHIELSLYRRLLRSWQEKSAPVWSEIKSACAEKNWAKARTLVADLDMSSVGYDNREYIKYCLWSMGIFGANMASNGDTTFVGTGKHDELMNQATTVFLMYLDHAATAEIQAEALQLIAESETANETVHKAEVRYVKPFVEFKDPGEGKLQLIASLHASRLATWGFAAEAEVRGITKYKLWNVMDGRTSKFCKMINGRVFEVEDARRKVNEALQVRDPEDLKIVQPWPSQTKDALEAYRQMSSEELSQLGLMIPPFHPRCRTVCVTLERDTGTSPVIAIQQSTVPKSVATMESFKELGIDLTEEQLQSWNAHIGVSPVDYLSALSGRLKSHPILEKPEEGEEIAAEAVAEHEEVSYPENQGNHRGEAESVITGIATGAREDNLITSRFIFTDKYRKQLEFYQHGQIEAGVESMYATTPFQVSATYDYFSGNFILDLADATGQDESGQTEFFQQLFLDTVDLSSSIGANTYTLSVGKGDAETFISLGFLPTPVMWQNVAMDALDDIQNPHSTLGRAFDDLLPEQQALLTQILQDMNESALQILINLPWVTEDGTKFSQLITKNLFGQFTIDLSDSNALAQFHEYMNTR